MQWPFGTWGADAVISGHDHTYERILVAGTVYFVNGLGGRSIYKFNAPVSGSQMRYNDDYGAMRVNADDVAIIFEFISLSGNIIDTYTIEARVENSGGGGGGGGGCAIRSNVSVDSSWLLLIIGFSMGFLRRHLLAY